MKKILAVIFTAAAIPAVVLAAAPDSPTGKYIIGESECEREAALYEKSGHSPAEVEGFRIGFIQKAEEDGESMAIVFHADGTLDFSGETIPCRIKGLSVEIQKQNRAGKWESFGRFSKDRKLFYCTLMNGIIFDLEE